MAKIFYTIGEVAEILDIPVSTVRFWEKSFDILRPQKSSAGHRKFTVADLENLKIIYHLVKEKGMTLEGARQRLRENPGGISHDQEIMDRLLNIRALLQEIRMELGGESENEVYREGQEAATTFSEDTGSPQEEQPLATPNIDKEPVSTEAEEVCLPEDIGPGDAQAPSEHIPTIIEQTLF